MAIEGGSIGSGVETESMESHSQGDRISQKSEQGSQKSTGAKSTTTDGNVAEAPKAEVEE
jgi:hypothetical protein